MTSGTAFAAMLQLATGALAPPPPPPQIYDPQSGPFIVRLNDDGRVKTDYDKIIANAVRNWSGTPLQAFLICFHRGTQSVDWRAASNAVTLIARKLKEHEAKVVVSPSGDTCAPGSAPVVSGPYVEIMGVVQR